MAAVSAQTARALCIDQALLLVVLVVFFCASAQAQSDAYSVEVAVADRSVAEQQNAYVAAFRRVLVNNSGDKTLLNRDQVRAGLLQAESYVSSFSYRTPPPGTVISSDTPITEQVRQSGQATQLMMVSFDRTLVRELIDGSATERSAQSDNPAPEPTPRSNSALVWLLIQDDGRDIMISDPAAVNVQRRAREIAGAAGVSLVFPVGDATDQQGVSADTLLQNDIARIQAASVRYEQDTLLVGTLTREGTRGWVGQWYKASGEEQQNSTSSTTNLDEALQQGLTLLGSSGALDESYRYGGNAASDTEALVWVGSMSSIGAYAQVINFLEQLPSVSTVYPKEVNEGSMVFAVLPRSALSEIDAALVSQNWLRRTTPTSLSASGSLVRNADLALEYAQ